MKPDSIFLKSILIYGLAFFLIVPTMAQISLDIDDLPHTGSGQISIKVDSLQGAALSPGVSGSNIIWDFSTLNPCCGNLISSSDTIDWISNDATPNAGYFPLSNIAHKERCYRYHSHITHQEETACYYNHYIEDNAGLWYYGSEDPTKVVFTSYLNVFPLLAYGDSLEHEAIIRIPTGDSLRFYHIFSKSTADGWGTIITPDTTASVIRITTTEKMYDTLYVNNVINDVHVYLNNYYYRWYAKKTGFPLLEINKGFQNQNPPFFQEVKYAKKSYSVLGINEINQTTGIHVFPNPFTSVVNIQLDPGNTLLSFVLYNSIGNKVITNVNINGNSIFIKGDMLPSGIYFYNLMLNKNDNFSGKLIKY